MKPGKQFIESRQPLTLGSKWFCKGELVTIYDTAELRGHQEFITVKMVSDGTLKLISYLDLVEVKNGNKPKYDRVVGKAA